MRNIKAFFGKHLNNPLFWIFIILSVGCMLAIGVFISEIYFQDFDKGHFCFSHRCVREFVEATCGKPLVVISETIQLIVSLATVGGIYLALKTYISNLNNSKLANHISHFSIFNNYINDELNRNTSIKRRSISVLAWYNVIFDSSRQGNLEISNKYIDFMNQLNNEINSSNLMASKATGGFFRYVDHQVRIQNTLRMISIEIDKMPRNDFYEVEDQILSLIRNVNRTFCYSSYIPEIVERRYL
jgi:hypothetical protein